MTSDGGNTRVVPELPETETLARDLGASLVGRIIGRVESPHADVLRNITARSISRRLAGRTVEGVSRRAKAVIIRLGESGPDSGVFMVVVPRFTGGLLLRAPGLPDDRYDCVRLRLTDGSSVAYRDVRRLGTVTVFNSEEFGAFDRRLGHEPLDPAFTPMVLSASLDSTQPVKKLLMDQRRIAGIGNIYANEALWAAKIDPSRPGRAVTEQESVALHGALVDILRRAIEARGTTFRDYRDASGRRGGFVSQLAAYGRGGEPCARCGVRLTMTHAIDGRATVFCHRCQQ